MIPEWLVRKIGLFVILNFLLKAFHWVVTRLNCYGPWVKPVNLNEFGSWSVVTGGTDGIGAEYCLQLAELGQNIIIIGRNEEKLKNMKSKITKLKKECITVKVDLAVQVVHFSNF